ncbi:hypothetical protein JTE90_026318 [Oedothorax gibbosus]|uniref:Uncharacterized protein n=1 Tax=Oedothorax gibbosus TaxID=931172 RepID=A0AAV6U691_9ARAC|nr:hypothetical protein JTE90_026318 [Oedothorax gibbosus]
MFSSEIPSICSKNDRLITRRMLRSRIFTPLTTPFVIREGGNSGISLQGSRPQVFLANELDTSRYRATEDGLQCVFIDENYFGHNVCCAG